MSEYKAYWLMDFPLIKKKLGVHDMQDWFYLNIWERD